MTQITQMPTPTSPQFGQSVKNWVETRDGTLGPSGLKYDRFVTLRDLYDPDFYNIIAEYHSVVQTTSEGNGFGSPTELTISGGVITLHDSIKWRFHSIDTEADVGTDDLDSIVGGNPGDVLLLQAEDSARTVVCKDGADLELQYDFRLNNTEDKLMLVCISSGAWHEIMRASNGA